MREWWGSPFPLFGTKDDNYLSGVNYNYKKLPPNIKRSVPSKTL